MAAGTPTSAISDLPQNHAIKHFNVKTSKNVSKCFFDLGIGRFRCALHRGSPPGPGGKPGGSKFGRRPTFYPSLSPAPHPTSAAVWCMSDAAASHVGLDRCAALA